MESLEQGIKNGKKKKEPRQLPTFPLPYRSSIIGLEELNFRVRNGTGCSLFSIATQILRYKLHQISNMSILEFE